MQMASNMSSTNYFNSILRSEPSFVLTCFFGVPPEHVRTVCTYGFLFSLFLCILFFLPILFFASILSPSSSRSAAWRAPSRSLGKFSKPVSQSVTRSQQDTRQDTRDTFQDTISPRTAASQEARNTELFCHTLPTPKQKTFISHRMIII